jgi:hypothetical protein
MRRGRGSAEEREKGTEGSPALQVVTTRTIRHSYAMVFSLANTSLKPATTPTTSAGSVMLLVSAPPKLDVGASP